MRRRILPELATRGGVVAATGGRTAAARRVGCQCSMRR
jgi:hypothetical protein